MKISIYNFKSISSVVNYELKPLTILSGINSSGKSSFIQLLLLFKQTLALDSSSNLLYLTGDYYQVQQYRDIIRNKDTSRNIKVVFEVNKSEFSKLNAAPSIFDSFSDYCCICEIVFGQHKGEVIVNEFNLKYSLADVDQQEQFINFRYYPERNPPFQIEANNSYFGKYIWEATPNITEIGFTSIFPTTYLISETTIEDGTKEGESIFDTKILNEIPKIDSFKSLLTNFFKGIHYIGPTRVEPLDEYSFKSDHQGVGTDGLFTAQVLANYGHNLIDAFIPTSTEEGTLVFKKEHISLLEATSIWICNVFKFGNKLQATKVSDTYTIYLTTEGGIETTIKHVGFGVSQVLPIIVEGLLMPTGNTLILEQPEIHLHPKVQSSLFDFIHSLILIDKKVIMETHSDHFITRMRRRVAEDAENQLLNEIKLTFVEAANNNLLFRSIDLDSYGSLDFFPDDFIEKTDKELKAIIKAQMKKRLTDQS